MNDETPQQRQRRQRQRADAVAVHGAQGDLDAVLRDMRAISAEARLTEAGRGRVGTLARDEIARANAQNQPVTVEQIGRSLAEQRGVGGRAPLRDDRSTLRQQRLGGAERREQLPRHGPLTTAQLQELISFERNLRQTPFFGHLYGVLIALARTLDRWADEITEIGELPRTIWELVRLLALAHPGDRVRFIHQLLELDLATEAAEAMQSYLRQIDEADTRNDHAEAGALVFNIFIHIYELTATLVSGFNAIRGAPAVVARVTRLAERASIRARRIADVVDERFLRELIEDERGSATIPWANSYRARIQAREFLNRADIPTGKLGPSSEAALTRIYARTWRDSDIDAQGAHTELATLERYLRYPAVERVDIVPVSGAGRSPDFVVRYRVRRHDASLEASQIRWERVEVTHTSQRTPEGIQQAIKTKADNSVQARPSQLTAPLPRGYNAPPEGAIVVRLPDGISRPELTRLSNEAIALLRADLVHWRHLRRIEIVSSGVSLVFRRYPGGNFFR